MSTQPVQPDSGGKTKDKSKGPANRIVPPNLMQAGIVIGAFTALLYLIELVDVAIPANLDNLGIEPRSVGGLDGVLWAPLLHGSWQHLFANTVPVVIFGFLVMANGLGQWIAVTLTIWLFSGLGVWLTGGGLTVGASGVVFGWLTFLLLRGVFNRSFAQLLVAVVLAMYWGSTLLGVLPGDPGISWQGHLFGAIGGVGTAWLVSLANKSVATQQPATSGPAG